MAWKGEMNKMRMNISRVRKVVWNVDEIHQETFLKYCWEYWQIFKQICNNDYDDSDTYLQFIQNPAFKGLKQLTPPI